jgi:membrane dipeptidase
MIRLLAQHGGVIQINFGAIFVNTEINRQFQTNEKATGRATVADVVDHIDRVVKLVGIDHVGLGSDFDGVARLPKGLTDVSGYPNLIAELLKRGYSEEAIGKICSGNFLRAWSAIQDAADRS